MLKGPQTQIKAGAGGYGAFHFLSWKEKGRRESIGGMGRCPKVQRAGMCQRGMWWHGPGVVAWGSSKEWQQEDKDSSECREGEGSQLWCTAERECRHHCYLQSKEVSGCISTLTEAAHLPVDMAPHGFSLHSGISLSAVVSFLLMYRTRYCSPSKFWERPQEMR